MKRYTRVVLEVVVGDKNVAQVADDRVQVDP